MAPAYLSFIPVSLFPSCLVFLTQWTDPQGTWPPLKVFTLPETLQRTANSFWPFRAHITCPYVRKPLLNLTLTLTQHRRHRRSFRTLQLPLHGTHYFILILVFPSTSFPRGRHEVTFRREVKDQELGLCHHPQRACGPWSYAYEKEEPLPKSKVWTMGSREKATLETADVSIRGSIARFPQGSRLSSVLERVTPEERESSTRKKTVMIKWLRLTERMRSQHESLLSDTWL